MTAFQDLPDSRSPAWAEPSWGLF